MQTRYLIAPYFNNLSFFSVERQSLATTLPNLQRGPMWGFANFNESIYYTICAGSSIISVDNTVFHYRSSCSIKHRTPSRALGEAPREPPAPQQPGQGRRGLPGTAPARPHAGDGSSAARQCLCGPKRRRGGFPCFRREGLGPSKYTIQHLNVYQHMFTRCAECHHVPKHTQRAAARKSPT